MAGDAVRLAADAARVMWLFTGWSYTNVYFEHPRFYSAGTLVVAIRWEP